MSGDGQQLPQGWVETTLGTVQLDLGRGVEPSRTPDETFELYSVPSHEHGAPEIIKGSDIGSNKQTVEPHTVLLCKINPRINRVWVTGNNSLHRKIASTEWIPFFPIPGLEPRYLAYFLRQDIVRHFLAGNASGVGGSLMRVRAGTFRDFSFCLAPLAEQIRIADALDELLSDLEAGVAALERAREKLVLYRASVLKAAVEGTLTAEWRQQHPDAEPVPELLKRILVERRRRWEEEQLLKFKEKDQELPKNWKAKYKEPVVPHTIDLPPLPEEWRWASADQLCSQITDGEHVQPRYQPVGRPMLSAKNVRNGFVDFSDIDFISNSDFANCLKRCAPTENDILIVSVGATTGRAAIVRSCEPFSIVRSVLLLRPLLLPRFLLFWLQSPWCQAYITRASGSSAQAHLYIGDTKRIPVPVPPASEQEALVEAVEDHLSVIDHIEAELGTKLKSAQTLRQAILRHAFTGQLVPQDPSDEPASELLKRIAAEREARVQDIAAAKWASKKNHGSCFNQRKRSKKTQPKDD